MTELTAERQALLEKTGSKKFTASTAFLGHLLNVDSNGTCMLGDEAIFDEVAAEFGCPVEHRFWYTESYRRFWAKKGFTTGKKKFVDGEAARKLEHDKEWAPHRAEKRAGKVKTKAPVFKLAGFKTILKLTADLKDKDRAQVLYNYAAGMPLDMCVNLEDDADYNQDTSELSSETAEV